MDRTPPSAPFYALFASLAVVVVTAAVPRPAIPEAPPKGLVVVTKPDQASASPGPPRALIPVDVVRVIDGDTVEVRAHVWLDQTIVTRVRLRSIDAPELRSGCPEEARKAAASQEALTGMLHGGRAYLTGLARDKYGGRVLGDLLTADGQAISTRMLAAGHARPYAGGRRQAWC